MPGQEHEMRDPSQAPSGEPLPWGCPKVQGRLEQPPHVSVPPDGYAHGGKKGSPTSFVTVAGKFKYHCSRSKSQPPSKGFTELNPNRPFGVEWMGLGEVESKRGVRA